MTTIPHNFRDYRAVQEMGRQIARKVEWDGQSIVTIFQAALEDANYHTFSQAIEAVWELQLKASEQIEEAVEAELAYERNVRGPAMRDAVEEMVKGASE